MVFTKGMTIWSNLVKVKNTENVNGVRLKMPTFSDLTPLTGCRFITKNSITNNKL
jgi:hypothetical protein